MTPEIMRLMLDSPTMRPDTALGLLNRLIFFFVVSFTTRAREQLYDMKPTDFTVELLGPEHKYYPGHWKMTFHEGLTKVNQGRWRTCTKAKNRADPVAYYNPADGNDPLNNVVFLYQRFISQRPVGGKCEYLFLAPKREPAVRFPSPVALVLPHLPHPLCARCHPRLLSFPAF